MAPAEYGQTTVDVEAGEFGLRATASVLVFQGFLGAYEAGPERRAEEVDNTALPELVEGQALELRAVLPHQHFTKPPPRYNEGSLVRALEENGSATAQHVCRYIETLRHRRYGARDGLTSTSSRRGSASP